MHLEETLKIEEEEGKLREKVEFHKEKALEEARLIARKQQEKAEEELQLQREEGARKKVVKKMIFDSDNSLAPITNVLVNFEGK